MANFGNAPFFLDPYKSQILLIKLAWDKWFAIKLPYSLGAKYATSTRCAQGVSIARYGHGLYAELCNEKSVYMWLWAYKSGYFD